MLGLVEPSGCRLSREELTDYMSLLCRSKLNCCLQFALEYRIMEYKVKIIMDLNMLKNL